MRVKDKGRGHWVNVVEKPHKNKKDQHKKNQTTPPTKPPLLREWKRKKEFGRVEIIRVKDTG